jgi:peptidoglycan/xylan/chitin deacetylase (PgdA/CDA1 family)
MKPRSLWLIPGVLARTLVLVFFHIILFGLIYAGYHPYAIVLTLLTVGMWACSVFWLGFPRGASVLHQIRDREEILLTFDDGPHPQYTPQLLDALQRHGVKAVFFLIGNHAKSHPQLVKRMVDEGHLLGNHTMTHPVASFWIAGPQRIFSEIQECEKILTSITDQPSQLFRPPVGHFAFFLSPLLRSFGMVCCLWKRRAFDGVDCHVARNCARLMNHVKAGDILVMHESNPNIVALVDEVLAGLQQRGLKSFSDLQHDQIVVKRSALVERADL